MIDVLASLLGQEKYLDLSYELHRNLKLADKIQDAQKEALGFNFFIGGRESAGELSYDALGNETLSGRTPSKELKGDVLLKQKQAWAQRYKSEILDLLLFFRKHNDCWAELVGEYSNVEYSIVGLLGNRDMLSLHKTNILSVLEHYRLSLFYSYALTYTYIEYSSWLRKEQTSSFPKPNMYYVNLSILKYLYGNGKDEPKTFRYLLLSRLRRIIGMWGAEFAQYYVRGKDLFLIFDESLFRDANFSDNLNREFFFDSLIEQFSNGKYNKELCFENPFLLETIKHVCQSKKIKSLNRPMIVLSIMLWGIVCLLFIGNVFDKRIIGGVVLALSFLLRICRKYVIKAYNYKVNLFWESYLFMQRSLSFPFFKVRKNDFSEKCTDDDLWEFYYKSLFQFDEGCLFRGEDEV